MKRTIAALLVVLLTLTGCAFGQAPETEPTPQTETTTTEPPVTIQTEPSTEPPTEPSEETLPPHSELYLEGLSVDAVILFFEEVCLDAEIVNSGNASRLQKWDAPITYRICGTPTEEDLATLAAFTEWLNAVPGFPGISLSETDYSASMDIWFCSRQQMADILGDWTWGCDGGVTFWYDNDRIWNATICISDDTDQQLRNSVIMEELYNGLGPVQDTDLREDSLIWSGYSSPQWMTEEDMLILKLLYHPDMEPGMDAESCARVIRELYY